MISVTGEQGIKATVVQDSDVVDARGKVIRITTFQLEYPRFIHAELMTHRVFSRNAASSRAIPVDAMIQAIEQQPAMPVWWGKNQSGMQAKVELDRTDREVVQSVWRQACKDAIKHATTMFYMKAHKQIVNRILEPFQMYTSLVTATEWSNFFALRRHPDAQPEIRELAEVMYTAQQRSVPLRLVPGEYHVPFIRRAFDNEDNELQYFDGEIQLTLDEALKISASCCAQVSYRKADTSLQKAIAIYDRLVESRPVHASPFEHQATPIDTPSQWYVEGASWVEVGDRMSECGATHIDRKGQFWCNNFRGWRQYRASIEGNVVSDE